jgi:hypothetical protein
MAALTSAMAVSAYLKNFMELLLAESGVRQTVLNAKVWRWLFQQASATATFDFWTVSEVSGQRHVVAVWINRQSRHLHLQSDSQLPDSPAGISRFHPPSVLSSRGEWLDKGVLSALRHSTLSGQMGR